jgi:hypothetical protein
MFFYSAILPIFSMLGKLMIEKVDDCFINNNVHFDKDISRHKLKPVSFQCLKNNKNLKVIGFLKCEYLRKIYKLIEDGLTIIEKYKKWIKIDLEKYCN